jgi:hypothetical protein
MNGYLFLAEVKFRHLKTGNTMYFVRITNLLTKQKILVHGSYSVEQSALQALACSGWLESQWTSENVHTYQRQNGYPLIIVPIEVQKAKDLTF